MQRERLIRTSGVVIPVSHLETTLQSYQLLFGETWRYGDDSEAQ